MTAGGQPKAMATGSRSPRRSATAWCAVESLWICQCMPTVLLVVLLQPVQAEVALAGLGVLGVGQAEVEEDAAVLGPGLQPGSDRQVDLVALEHDLLARRDLHLPGRHRPQLHDLAERVAQAADTARQLGLEQLADPLADLVEGL